MRSATATAVAILLSVETANAAPPVPPAGKCLMVIGGGYHSKEWDAYVDATGKIPGGVCLWQRGYKLDGLLYQGSAPTSALLIQFDITKREYAKVERGERDEELKLFAREVAKLKKPVYMVLMGEADFRTEHHDLSPVRYRNIYRHIHDLWDGEGAHNVVWVFHLACHANPSDQIVEGCYPGDQYVDMVGTSFYGRGNLAGAAKLSRFGKLRGKPFMIAESSATFVQKSPGLREWGNFFGPLFWFAERCDARIIHYNNINDSEASAGAPVDSFLHMAKPVLDGWTKEMDRSRYLHGSEGLFTQLTASKPGP